MVWPEIRPRVRRSVLKANSIASASVSSAVDAQGAQFGDHAKVAGRDINETVNNIEKMLGDVQSMANATVETLQVLNQETHRRPALKRRRQESIRWESADPEFRRRLELVSNSRADDWTHQWIDLCLENRECLNEIREFIQEKAISGWTPSDANFDNTREGLHIGITFERELKIPGV